MIAFFYVPKQEKGGGKACSFRGTAWVSCWGPAWSGQGTVELFILLPSLVLFISTILQVYTFTLGWINYLTHSILQLKGEYLIAGKQMALPFWVCSTRTKKKKKKLLACSHIPIGCDLVRFHQPGKFGYDDWSVTEFFKAKKKKPKPTPTFYFLYQFSHICIPWKERKILTLPVFLAYDTSLSTTVLLSTITSTFLLSSLLQIF